MGVVVLGPRRARPPLAPTRAAADSGLAGANAVSIATIAAALLVGRRARLRVSRSAPPGGRSSFTATCVALFGLLLVREALDGWRRQRHGLVDRRLGPRDWILILLGLALVGFLLSLGPVVNVAARPIGPGLYAWLQPYRPAAPGASGCQSHRRPRGVRRSAPCGPWRDVAPCSPSPTGVRPGDERDRSPTRAGVRDIPAGLRASAGAPPPGGPSRSRTRRPTAWCSSGRRTRPGRTPIRCCGRIGHGKRVVNGYSGFVPQLLAKLSKLMTEPGPPFPDARGRGLPPPHLSARLPRGAPRRTRIWLFLGARRGGSSDRHHPRSSISTGTTATRTSGM